MLTSALRLCFTHSKVGLGDLPVPFQPWAESNARLEHLYAPESAVRGLPGRHRRPARTAGPSLARGLPPSCPVWGRKGIGKSRWL